jgi:hypothetical protein
MRKFWNKLKENDFIVSISSSNAAMVFSSCMMIVSALFYFVLTPKWVSDKSQFGPSPKMVPNLLTIGIFISALVVFVTELCAFLKRTKNAETSSKTELRETPEGGKEETDYFEQLLEEANEDTVTLDLRGFGYILAAIAACVFYVLCADYLGFMLVVAIIVASLMLLYGARNPLIIITMTAIMSVGVYFAFTKLLSLVLPSGTLFF